MITRIASREFTDTLRDGRFRWSAGIVLALLLVALGAGFKSYREVRAQHDTAREEMRAFWVNQPAKNPHSAAHYGLWAFKPRTLLSLVDQGVDPYVGVAAYLEAHKQNEFQFRPAMDATAAQRFGQWTAASILQVLMPLLIVVLVFPAFAGEREQGTLRQLLSLGVPAAKLALGKALGLSMALGAVMVPATVLGVVTLTLAASEGTFGVDWSRLALLTLTYLVYFAAFVAVSLLVSARARSSRVALLALLGFWAVNSLIAPRVMTDAARRVHPTPSAFEFVSAIDRDLKSGLDGHSPSQLTETLRQETLKAYGVSTLDSLPVNFDAISMQASEVAGDKVFDKHYGALYDAYARQNRIQQLGAMVAPLLAVRSISMGLAGTDVEHHRAFATAAEQYRRQLVKAMNDDMARHSRTGDWDYKAPASLWSTLPPFEFEAPGATAALGAHLPAVWILVAWCFAACAAVARLRHLRTE